jgi:hypothetical protein
VVRDQAPEIQAMGMTATAAARAPFDLRFADSGVRDPAGFGALVGMLCTGGRIVMDDVTPQRALPADSPLRGNGIERDFSRTPA